MTCALLRASFVVNRAAPCPELIHHVLVVLLYRVLWAWEDLRLESARPPAFYREHRDLLFSEGLTKHIGRLGANLLLCGTDGIATLLCFKL